MVHITSQPVIVLTYAALPVVLSLLLLLLQRTLAEMTLVITVPLPILEVYSL